MTTEALLRKIRVARPCPTSWSDMAGDGRVRFCGLCRKNVYNFSALTSQEALELLQSRAGTICGLLYRRTDGTIITSDCPVGRQIVMARLGRRLLATAAGLLLSLGGRLLTPDFKARVTATRIAASAATSTAQHPPLTPDQAEARQLLGSLGYIQ